MKDKYIKNARRAFLADTIGFYVTGNRATVETRCQYATTPTSPGCAIGRHVLNKRLCEQWDRAGSVNVDSFGIYWNLPPSLQMLGPYFLRRAQCLHDWPGFWTETGLSEAGLAEIRAIERAYDL